MHLRREAGEPKPWTNDVILQGYRFCNIHRELDTVTKWIRDHWSNRYEENPDLWFAMVVARLVNWPKTLAMLQPLPYNSPQFIGGMRAAKVANGTNFGPAYIVSTNGQSMPKDEYLAKFVLEPMWCLRTALRPKENDTLQEYHRVLMGFRGMGSFMAAQVVADLKNCHGNWSLKNAEDWWTWAAPGPGSLRGLSRVAGRGAVRTGWKDAVWLEGVNELREHIQEHMDIQICAQDTQNCLCEYDKYERVRLGEGTPKQRYQGAFA